MVFAGVTLLNGRRSRRHNVGSLQASLTAVYCQETTGLAGKHKLNLLASHAALFVSAARVVAIAGFFALYCKAETKSLPRA
jgi:hypothetical protein